MIDEYYTFIFFGYHDYDLSDGSQKQVVSVCDDCYLYRVQTKNHYHGLCISCAAKKRSNKPEWKEHHSKVMVALYEDKCNRDARSKEMLKYFVDNPDARDVISEMMFQYNKNHPEKGKEHSEWMIEYCKDPEVLKRMSENITERFSDQNERDKLSETLKNSEAAKSEQDRQRGGFDIVYHHYLYDHADLSKYTMPMTRSDHTAMHHRMRADGYEVPCINSETDDNGLWGYK